MIPSTTNHLMVAEDWTKIYQSFRNADFKSYDFETLRRTMIGYLRENYPEEFNDYIDSSEYIALVDLIAFLGQNLSFRIDLNARENFLETAERRDSIIRLASLISYNVRRNKPANGFLKIASISTTENVFDSNGINLSNSIVGWNDPTNSNWYQQFLAIMNASMASPAVFGKPFIAATIDGIRTEQYRINTTNSTVPVFSFSKNINGTQMNFDIVSSTFANQTFIYEEAPLPAGQLGIIFKNDNQGSGSANTGFFVYFKQGKLAATNFSVDNPVPNELIGINVSNINDSDVWLWQLSSDGSTQQTLWTKVPAITGNNVIYNSLNAEQRNIYGVLSRQDDQIDLTFADGSFGNLPNGQFRLYYRQSNGLVYSIKPEQMNNISVQIPYASQSGQQQLLTIILSLQYTIENSSAAESDSDIRLKAPQAYYTQNRMVTAEDYNISPLTVDADVIKVKSINRVSSGISKYFELSDISGKYSFTNIFADDGILYREDKEYTFEFSFSNRNEIFTILKNQLEPIIRSPGFEMFYLNHYPTLNLTDYGLTWVHSNKTTNQSRGYFEVATGPVSLGVFGSGYLSFFEPDSLLKFIPPTGKFFLPDGKLTSIKDDSTSNYMWVQIAGVVGDGSNSGKGNLDNGLGPVILTGSVYGDGTSGNSALPSIVIPNFHSIIAYALEVELANFILSKRNFGLSFDAISRTWYIITDSNLDLISPFSLAYQKDVSNINKDSSWMVAFEWTGKQYNVRYRVTEYLFESDKETAFFIDKSKRNYDFTTDSIIKDKIIVLSVNKAPDTTLTTIIDKVTSISTTTTIGTTASIVTLNTSDITIASTNSNAVLTFLYTIPIEAHKYVAIHPDIYLGSAEITAVSTTTITLANILTKNINTGSIISFLPKTVSVTNTYDITNELTSIGTFTFFSSEIHQEFQLEKDYQWQIDGPVIESDGFIEPKKVLISFFDRNERGQIDDPDAFNNIVAPDSLCLQTGFKDNFVFFQVSSDGLRYKLYYGQILSYPTENDVPGSNLIDGQLYYFYDPAVNVVKRYTVSNNAFTLEPSYYGRSGRSNLKFHYVHNSGDERRLDPSKMNIIDIYMLTKSYDLSYRNWLATGVGAEPLPPTTQSLEENFSSFLEPIKAISDEIVYHPAKYKILFGSKAVPQLQATFKAVSNPARPTSTTNLQTRILSAIEDFFNVDNWQFGQTFNFGELATYVMNIMTPDILNFIIVPNMENSFGSLYQITCESNEIFVSGTTVNNIQIITSLTASNLKASGVVITS